MTPAQIAFVKWLKRKHPGVYAEAMRDAQNLNGAGLGYSWDDFKKDAVKIATAGAFVPGALATGAAGTGAATAVIATAGQGVVGTAASPLLPAAMYVAATGDVATPAAIADAIKQSIKNAEDAAAKAAIEIAQNAERADQGLQPVNSFGIPESVTPFLIPGALLAITAFVS